MTSCINVFLHVITRWQLYVYVVDYLYVSTRDFVIHVGVFFRQGACAENVNMILILNLIRQTPHIFQFKERFLGRERIFQH